MTSETQAPTPDSPPEPPAHVPAQPTGGVDRVDRADCVDRVAQLLDSLEDRPLAEHPDAYEQVHVQLSDALASIDDA